MPRVTLDDVARHAGVSMKTVSNVVRGYQHVSAAMRERVQASIEELGYRPNLRGRSLAMGRSNMLTFAFPDLRRPYFAELAHGLALAAADRGYRLLFEETGGTADGERAVLRGPEAGLVDGVVLHPQALAETELAALQGELPMVLLGENPLPDSVDRVAIDNVAAAAEAVAHLVALGRTRIGFLGHEVGELSRPSELRLEGYRLGLRTAGLGDARLHAEGLATDDGLLIARANTEAVGGELALGAALDAGLRVDALLCRDDLAAVGALRALRLRGFDVPGDVAIVGWDAIGIAEVLVPSLSSVEPDGAALAERALDLLIERMEGYDGPGRRVTVGHRIRVGESAPSAPVG